MNGTMTTDTGQELRITDATGDGLGVWTENGQLWQLVDRGGWGTAEWIDPDTDDVGYSAGYRVPDGPLYSRSTPYACDDCGCPSTDVNPLYGFPERTVCKRDAIRRDIY